MTTPESPETPIDPRLKAMLDNLQPTPARDPEAAARGRARFINELAELGSLNQSVQKPSLINLAKERWTMFRNTLGQRIALTTLTVMIVAVVFLFGSATVTAYAAQGALPGDALYAVKTSLEGTRLALTGNAAAQFELHLQYAERRLAEVSSLIDNKRFDDVGVATAAFQAHIQDALAELKIVSANDPQKAGELAGKITSALTRYAQVLSGMAAGVPDAVQADLLKALSVTMPEGSLEVKSDGELEFVGVVSEISANTWTIGGRTFQVTAATEIKGAPQVGSLVKVHASLAADGSLTAREIELAAGDDLGGGDDNDNGNANDGNDNGANDDNGNDANANDNGGDDGNDNGANDDNGNDNGGDDGNDNGGDDGNDNGGDDGNDNGGDDGNDNGGDDGNDNGGDDGNDNGGDDGNDNGGDDGNDNGGDDGNDNGGDDGNDNGGDDDNDNGGDDDNDNG
jgi:hypothetical protein